MTFGTSAPTVLDLVSDAAAAQGEHVAVQDADGALTYGELGARADRLADHLRGLGIAPGDLVGLCLDRSAGLVVSALAILRCGAAYVAIDPRYPEDRVRWMLDDSRAAAVISDAVLAFTLSHDGRPGVSVTGDGQLLGDPPPDIGTAPGASTGPADLAYVVYTSGSTGTPKGVPVEHAALANLVDWHRSAFALEAGDQCTQIASPGFDAAAWEIWPTLAAGATLHVVPEPLRSDPAGLRDWLVAQRITVTFLPTALAEPAIGLAWPADCALRYLLTGGDALTRRPPPDLGFAVVNNYGLCETAVVATSGVVDPLGEGPPTIGRPISGIVAEVLDAAGNPAAEGELVIGGVAVATGYLGRPELTVERFLDGPDGRRYRTGDRVRLRTNGEIEFLGRTDDQLSIRGFRVEPGEVAAALSGHPAVDTSVSVGVGRSSGDRQLVAYLVPTGAERPNRAELSAFLGAVLPEHMVPSRFVWLDALPMTEHGKIDRDALPAPDAEDGGEIAAGRPPATEVEAATAAVIAELLEVSEVAVDQNFFLLGGHSMLGAQLIARLEDMYGVEVLLRYLFDNPTAAAIAAEVERQMADAPAGGLVAG